MARGDIGPPCWTNFFRDASDALKERSIESEVSVSFCLGETSVCHKSNELGNRIRTIGWHFHLRWMIMGDWAEKEAEAIVDRFVADESSADLLRLQQSIAQALRTAYEKGKKEKH